MIGWQKSGPQNQPSFFSRFSLGIGQNEAGASEAAGGARDGGEDQRVRVLGVFGQVERGRPRGV